jgi:hypothetical protein
MAVVRIVKTFDVREIKTKGGRLLYVVQAVVNLRVGETEEFIANIFSPNPNLFEGTDYEVGLNNINLRLRDDAFRVSGFPGIPGVPIPGVNSNPNIKNPKEVRP